MIELKIHKRNIFKTLTNWTPGVFTFFAENRKTIVQIIVTVFFIGMGIYFVKHEKGEFSQIRETLNTAQPLWVLLGIAITSLYIALQALMYVFSFRAIHKKITFQSALLLFLKRNFISVFLPAGGVSSLAFFTKPLEEQNISKTKIHFASTIYAFIGILSVLIVAIPAIIFTLIKETTSSGEISALIGLLALTGLLIWAFRSITRHGVAYRFILKLNPEVSLLIDEINSQAVDRKAFFWNVMISILIEFCGIAHLLIAMVAFGFKPDLEAAVIGYIVSVMFLILSPFMRGLGAIELSLSFILTRYGFSTIEAVSITLLYRIFEFWIPLAAGLKSFVFVKNHIILRVIPVVLTFTLGIVNIISAITPAIPQRLAIISDLLPLQAIHASNYFTLTSGMFLLGLTAYMIRGLKTAWLFAFVLSIVSMVGHLIKAIDYEEASLALFLCLSLWMTRKEYYVKGNPEMRQLGIKSALIAIGAVMLYGIIGFYYLDKKYFNIDFSVWQSIGYTLQNFFLFHSSDLIPSTLVVHRHFAQNFLISINIAGFISMSFLFYTLIRPYVFKVESIGDEHLKATNLITQYGRSGLDYFKTYSDKLFYFATSVNGFVSYRIKGTFAVVLENPVCEDEEALEKILKEFDQFCLEHGLKSLYYRVPENSLPLYQAMKKKSLIIGQEAILDLNEFSLEGRSRKSLRNSCNTMKAEGWFIRIYEPPVKDGLLQKLKSVSEDWLNQQEYSELVFAQGKFDIAELKHQTIIAVENEEEKVAAFANIIPDYAPGETTYDLIRKAENAPKDSIDYLMIEMFLYMKSKRFQHVNMGLAPMSGIEQGKDFPEKTIKFAYEQIRSFSHYKGLRGFKEKFDPEWQNRYLIYEHDYDLLQAPVILSKVFKP
jgi:phosphatidylglycerol lysyltransferase